MTIENWNCDGSGPHAAGEVRRLPTGPGSGGSAVILCRACHRKELAWRRERNKSLGAHARFSLPSWESLEVYGEADEAPATDAWLKRKTPIADALRGLGEPGFKNRDEAPTTRRHEEPMRDPMKFPRGAKMSLFNDAAWATATMASGTPDTYRRRRPWALSWELPDGTTGTWHFKTRKEASAEAERLKPGSSASGKAKAKTRKSGPWKSVAAIKAANAALGLHFFSRDNARFFGSKIHGDTISGRYFVTSEQDENGFGRLGQAWNGTRRYTIRVADDAGRIDSASEFGEYATAGEARAAAKKLKP